MSRLFVVLAALLVGSLVLAAPAAFAQQQPAPAAPAPRAGARWYGEERRGEDQELGRRHRHADAGRRHADLGPPTVKIERDKVKEGASVKASYEVKGGKNVAKTLQVQ